MMLPQVDTFVCLMNEGPSMDKKDGHWSGISMEKEVRARDRTMELPVVISAL